MHSYTHSFTHPPHPPFALPIPTGTDNIVLSYKKDFFSCLHCGNYWINADGERHLHVKVLASLLCTADVPLSFTQIMLLRYRRERERERERGCRREGQSDRESCSTLSYSPPSVSYRIHVGSVLQVKRLLLSLRQSSQNICYFFYYKLWHRKLSSIHTYNLCKRNLEKNTWF